MDYTVKPRKSVKGEIFISPDKSVSHRALMFSAIAEGVSEIENYLMGEDCISTINCFRNLGIKVEVNETKVRVFGNGLRGLTKPSKTLNVNNSGTTIRLISGILAGQSFESTLTGDSSICKRPMNRVILPLTEMGANIKSNEGFAPMTITGGELKGISYKMPVASAQVKSAIILASLYAEGETNITEILKSRDHTELMLNYLGADIKTTGLNIKVKPQKKLTPAKIKIPGDISSAAFFIVAATVLPNSHLIIKDTGLNKTRTGIIDALLKMGANIKIHNERNVSGETTGTIEVKSADLKAIELGGSLIPRMIDEIPIFAAAAIFAEGTTVIKDAEELKVKESNRIKTVCTEFKKAGAKITETNDGMIIEGTGHVKGAVIETYGDHRISMSAAILGLCADEEIIIKNAESCNVSFPKFFEVLEQI